MRLSEAIRLGAMDHPQAFGVLVTADGARCALGSALLAVGIPVIDSVFVHAKAFAQWPILGKHGQQCPVCEWFYLCNVAGAIAHLNDCHRWTREQIADWVETIECAQEPESHREPAVVVASV